MIKRFNTKSNKCVLFNNFRRDNLSHDILKYIGDNLNMHCDKSIKHRRGTKLFFLVIMCHMYICAYIFEKRFAHYEIYTWALSFIPL